MTKVPPSLNSPLDGLVDLACRDGVDVRPTLLRVLTDLYVQKPTHSADEETQYVELALGLIDTVDDADPRRGGRQPVRLPGRAGGRSSPNWPASGPRPALTEPASPAKSTPKPN